CLCLREGILLPPRPRRAETSSERRATGIAAIRRTSRQLSQRKERNKDQSIEFEDHMKTTHLISTKARIARAAVTVAAGMASVTAFGAGDTEPAADAKPAADANAKPPADAKPPEKKHWETSASAGLTLARGNSHSFMVSAGINSSRKWSKD